MIDYSPKYKIDDIVEVIDPDLNAYHWGKEIVTDIEKREHGGITVKFKNNTGYLFQEEIVLIKKKED